MRLIVKLCSQGLLVLAALLSGTWSLLDLLHVVNRDGTVQVLGFNLGPKDPAELILRVILSVSALMSIAATDIWDIYVPRRKLRDFRKDFLDHQIKVWRKQLGNDIRVSVLYARRRWYFPLWRVFEWAWSNGYDPPSNHKDVNLKLTCCQGVSGEAFKAQGAKSAYYAEDPKLSFAKRWLLRNKYHMTYFQLKRMKGLRGIISVALLRRYGPKASPEYESVGVINLDTRTQAGADLLKNNEDALVTYFAETGLLLAMLDM